jgi:hypothetical protein
MTNDTGAYDILVWIDEDGDVVCQCQSQRGHEVLQELDPTAEYGDTLQIMCAPEEFERRVPGGLRVGLVMHPSKTVVPMGQVRLH